MGAILFSMFSLSSLDFEVLKFRDHACAFSPHLLSLASWKQNGFPVNVYSMNGVSYTEEYESRGYWLKNTQDSKLLMLILWWLFLFVSVLFFVFLQKEQVNTHNIFFLTIFALCWVTEWEGRHVSFHRLLQSLNWHDVCVFNR